MASQENNLVLPLKNHNGDQSGCDSRGQPMVKNSHRNALCTDEEAERPQEQQPMKDLTNAVINQKTGKRYRSVSTRFGNNESPRKSCAAVINNGEHIAPSSKRPRRSQASVSYKEHESESERDMEDFHDSQNVSNNDETKNSNAQNPNLKSRTKNQRKKRAQAKKKNLLKCLVKKSMQSHGDNIAYIWMQDGNNIHKYELKKAKSRASDQKRLYKKTECVRCYNRKHKARYQAIRGWKPYNGGSKNCLPEVVEVTSWDVMAGREVGYEDYKSYLECIIKTALDGDFLENIHQNDNGSEQYIQAFGKVDSMLENFLDKIRSTAWKPDYEAIMERCPSKTSENIIKPSLLKEICEVCKRRESIASSIVQFEGPKYDPETLKEFSEEEDQDNKRVKEVMSPGDDDDYVVYKILTTKRRWVESEHYLFNWLLLQSDRRFKKYQKMRTQKYHDRRE